MLITIKVPENTGRLFYSVVKDGYEEESVPVTMGMIVDVKAEATVTIEETYQFLDGGVEKRISHA